MPFNFQPRHSRVDAPRAPRPSTVETCARGFPVFLSAATCHPGRAEAPSTHVPGAWWIPLPHVTGSPCPWRDSAPETVTQAPGECE